MGSYCVSGSGSIFSHPHDAQVVCQPPRSPTCPEKLARSARSLGHVPILCACGLCSILLSPSMGHWKGEWLSLGRDSPLLQKGTLSVTVIHKPVASRTPCVSPPSSLYLCQCTNCTCSWLCYPCPLFRRAPIRRPKKNTPQLLHHPVVLKRRLDFLGVGFCNGQCLCPQEAPPCRP